MRIAALETLTKDQRKDLIRAFRRRRRLLGLVWYLVFAGTLAIFVVGSSQGSGGTDRGAASHALDSYVWGYFLFGYVFVAVLAAEAVYRMAVADCVAKCIEQCQCIACGYSLKGLERHDDRAKCPECGSESPVAAPSPEGGIGR
ncbi:MAG TPA: hypothetical protein VG797_07955 [Phycisphaerales bacterium]|nr:hypothetical protein [Phycisphaerales bacterium]